MELLRKSTLILSIIISFSIGAKQYPRDFTYSFFEKIYKEQAENNNFVIVHLKEEKLQKVIYKSQNSDTEALILGTHVDNFFNHDTDFPLGDYEEMIAILYQNDQGYFERKDDGHDSDSYVYDDRLIFSNKKLSPLYGDDIFPGIKTLDQKRLEQVIMGELESKPSAIRCGNIHKELPSKKIINNKVFLESDYLGNNEELFIQYDEKSKKLIFSYKLRGDDPHSQYFDLPKADDISYRDGFYYGKVSIFFTPYKWKTIQFPQDLLFGNQGQTSERFKAALTSLYYGFMNPRVCSFERSLI